MITSPTQPWAEQKIPRGSPISSLRVQRHRRRLDSRPCLPISTPCSDVRSRLPLLGWLKSVELAFGFSDPVSAVEGRAASKAVMSSLLPQSRTRGSRGGVSTAGRARAARLSSPAASRPPSLHSRPRSLWGRSEAEATWGARGLARQGCEGRGARPSGGGRSRSRRGGVPASPSSSPPPGDVAVSAAARPSAPPPPPPPPPLRALRPTLTRPPGSQQRRPRLQRRIPRRGGRPEASAPRAPRAEAGAGEARAPWTEAAATEGAPEPAPRPGRRGPSRGGERIFRRWFGCLGDLEI